MWSLASGCWVQWPSDINNFWSVPRDMCARVRTPGDTQWTVWSWCQSVKPLIFSKDNIHFFIFSRIERDESGQSEQCRPVVPVFWGLTALGPKMYIGHAALGTTRSERSINLPSFYFIYSPMEMVTYRVMNCYIVMCSLWRSRTNWTQALKLPQPRVEVIR